MNKYLYEIRPVGPIKDLIPGRVIYKPCSLQLTKEEVKKCMRYGSVWRKFPGKTPVRVTGENLNSMHQKEFSKDITKHIIPRNDLDNINKIKIILYHDTKEWYFADITSGEKNDYFTSRYKDSTRLVNNKVAYINGIKKEIPIEIKFNTQHAAESDNDSSIVESENRGFLSGKGEESSAHTYNKNNSSSKNNKHKYNKK